jgi:hypothetical protein
MTTGINDHLTQKLYDLSYVERIARGEKTVVTKMLMTFINTIPATVDKIREAYTQKDFFTIQRLVHKVKPVFSIYVVLTLEKELTSVEQWAAVEIDHPEMNSWIQKITDVVQKIVDQMINSFITK